MADFETHNGGHDAAPMPCFVCGEKPTVGSFLLMDMRHYGWTCLCPNGHYETEAYYSRDAAVMAWNEWVENEGVTEWEDE